MMSVHWTRYRRPLVLAIVLATALFFGPTMIASAVSGPPWMPPMGARQLDQLSGDAFDQAFLTQMTMHHAMGVMMTQPVVARGAHQELKDLGAQMIADQSREIDQMRGWLQGWYGQDVACPMPQGSTPAMMPGMGMPMMPGGPTGTMPGRGPGMMPGGMGPGMMPGGMGPGMMPGGMGPEMMPGAGPMMPGTMPAGMGPGMMPDGPMMGGFWNLPPDQLDATYMTWMIGHHQGAIEMAMLADDRAEHQEVKDLAANIITTQSAEIETMQGWLTEWYGR